MLSSIFIIVLNYNNYPDTLECLKSLQRLNYDNYSTVVIDNGSTDGSVENIEAWFNDKFFGKLNRTKLQTVDANCCHCRNGFFEHTADAAGQGLAVSTYTDTATTILIKTGANLGYAGGNNMGIRYALDQGADYIWLLNNDTEVHPDSLIWLVKRVQEDDSIGIVGSTLLYHHERNRVQALGGGRYNKWLGVAKHIGEGQNWDIIKDNILRDEIERRMDYVVGASMLVSRRFIETVGLMSEDYFLYFEELDWAIRGKEKGFKLAWAPESIVYHKEGATIGSSSEPMKKSYVADYWGIRNRILFTRKFYPWLLPSVYAGLIGSAVKRILRGQPERAGMILKLMIIGGRVAQSENLVK